MRPRQDSNLRSRLRRAVLYPLSYGGPAFWAERDCTSGRHGPPNRSVPFQDRRENRWVRFGATSHRILPKPSGRSQVLALTGV